LRKNKTLAASENAGATAQCRDMGDIEDIDSHIGDKYSGLFGIIAQIL
jgi:hypothetical protein